MKLTENFTLEELTRSATAQRLGISNQPTSSQLENLKRLCERILQPIRDKYGKPIRVTSGFRNDVLNRAVEGVVTSQHRNGEAADIVCEDNNCLFNLIREMISKGELTVGQLINEHNLSWIHISLPNEKHRNEELRIK